MTALESIRFVYQILDESHRTQYVGNAVVCDMLSKAQLFYVRRAISEDDERLLRPFIERPTAVANGDILPDCLEVRGVRININAEKSTTATRMLYEEWLNRDAIGIGAVVQQATYAVYNPTGDADGDTRIYFAGISGEATNTLTAQVQYVRRPLDVSYTSSTVNQGLEVPKEYAPEICVLAAHFLTTTDVTESAREQILRFAGIPESQEGQQE